MNQADAFEIRTPPYSPSLIASALKQPGQWVYDIDFVYPPAQRVPPEAIRGAWESGGDGKLTGRYAPNARYRPIVRKKPDLKPYMHAGAKTNRNQWIVEIDPRGESLFPDVPEKLIRGWWYVDSEGMITNMFRENSQSIDVASEASTIATQ